MHLKSSLFASRWGLAFLIFIAAACTVTPAFADLTKIVITAPASQTVTCPTGAPGGAPCVNLIHSQTVQFSVTYTGVAPFDPTIAWSFGGGTGTTTLGTLSSTGLYTAPASIFSGQNNIVVITATSAVSGVAAATATVYLIPTVGISISPTSATLSDGQTLNLSAPVTGTLNTGVTWTFPGGTPPGTFLDTGIQTVGGNQVATAQYTAPVPITARQSFTITATSAASGGTVSATSTITLVPAGLVGITVSPPTATLRASETQQFTAAVVGLSSTTVNWSVSCAALNSAGTPQTCSSNIGQIQSTGLYISPNSVPYTELITVTATSVGTDVNGNTLSGTATVTLTPPTITITPASVTLSTNQMQQFVASINGNTYTNVTWSLSSPIGSIDNNGNYTAPAFASAKLTIQVIATDNADPTGTHIGTANVTITQSAATITPSSVTLSVGGPTAPTQQFTFNIDGVADMNPAADVQWTLSVSNMGTISATGLYTAPAAITANATVTLTGTYLQDATKTATAKISLTLYTDVGHGAPNAAMTELFITNFYRNNFNNLVSLPPLGDVKKLGATGYVQEFSDANKTSGVKYALVKPNASTVPNANGTPLIFQLYGDVYGYYTTVGQTTAGYPTEDEQSCPYFSATNTCNYDIFDKPAALFVYSLPVFATQTQFIISGVYYTEWLTLGGLAGAGRPVDAVTTGVTSPTANTASVQLYSNGAIYQITKGPNLNQVFAVLGPIYTLYAAQGGTTGYLGLPTSAETIASTGVHNQSFEGGAIQYTPGSGAVVVLPVASVSLGSFSGTQPMVAGATMTLMASAYTASGAALTDRPFTWSTSNGQVAIVTPSGANNSVGTVTAVGAGTASIRVSAGGIVSLPVNLSVTAPCCQIGEGAPSQTITQAFQNAVTRNHLSVVLPAQNPVQRVGHGYVQQLQDATQGSTAIYLIAKSDNSPAAYMVTGAILTVYQSAQFGGPAGSLGYPTEDPTPGGTQTFENTAALAGSPVLLVSGAIYTKWSGMGFETGAAGTPSAAATTFKTVGANAGNQQLFQNGAIFAATSGPRAGQTYFVGNLILSAYNGVGGPGGAYGMPISDEFVSGTTHQQNFEGGNITYNTGDTVAQVHPISQKPAVTAPTTVLAGSRAHLAVTGFQAGDTIQVAVTGQPTFTVVAANGAYSWDVYVPLTAKAATITVQATDPKTTDSATATYSILSLSSNRAAFTKVQGDVQSGLPGALLAQPIVVALLDQSGNPVIGAPVTFQASPGALIVQASSVTDSSGHAQAGLRLQTAQGLAAVTVDSPGIASAPVIFYATATSSSLASFPKLTQTLTTPLGNGTATIAQKGALLVSAANIIRYYQNNNALPSPNGLADVAPLNTFLKSFCIADSTGKQICDGFLVNPDSGEQVVNLWRLGAFVSGGLDVVAVGTDPNSIRDQVAAGSPVLLSLSITGDTSQPGGAYVVAMGVGPNGEVLIQDPNPLLAQPELDNYLAGFTADGHNWTGKVLAAVRLAPQAPLTTRFLLQAVSQPPALLQNLTLQVSSVAGSCGQPLDFADAIDATSALPQTAQRVSRFVYCNGSQPLYQIDVGTSQPYKVSLTDFTSGGTSTDLSGSSLVSYQASRPSQLLVLAPQGLALLSGGVVNGASFTPGIAPGGLVSIFGSGLSVAGSASAVTINGESAQVLVATPFQINAQVPADLPPASYTLQVQSPFGSASQQVVVTATAPAIFVLGTATQGAVVNQDGTINSDTNPVVRGQAVVIYCTGLGAVTKQGNLSVAATPVQVVLAGSSLTPSFAGLTAGFVGLYQVNVTLPGGAAPGLDLPLSLSQGGATSNSVALSVQ